jgi:hypothetical protein
MAGLKEIENQSVSAKTENEVYACCDECFKVNKYRDGRLDLVYVKNSGSFLFCNCFLHL